MSETRTSLLSANPGHLQTVLPVPSFAVSTVSSHCFLLSHPPAFVDFKRKTKPKPKQTQTTNQRVELGEVLRTGWGQVPKRGDVSSVWLATQDSYLNVSFAS